MSLHLSKCHIVGNHMWRLISCGLFTAAGVVEDWFEMQTGYARGVTSELGSFVVLKKQYARPRPRNAKITGHKLNHGNVMKI